MKREIKFRGLTGNEKWVYGNLIQGKNGTCYICSINENPICKNGDYWYIDSPCYKVIPETIGQYTGSKDRKGNDIYEGDILEDGFGSKGVVIWDNDDASFSVEYNNEELQSFSNIEEWSEIVGNIYG